MKIDSKHIEHINEAFRGYKAEWLESDVYKYFQRPFYFKALQSPQPCVLVGGRGSGKTTALMGLSYEGKYALARDGEKDPSTWKYFGFFHRVNTTRTATLARISTDSDQKKLFFSHYINLVICENVVKFLIWYEEKTKTTIELKNLQLVSRSLRLDHDTKSILELKKSINDALDKMADCLNGEEYFETLHLSILGKPIDCIFDLLKDNSEFNGKRFFYILDEYENFREYQQEIVNSLIKHAAPRYIFKVGVREYGFITKKCSGTKENLEHPADYNQLKIEDTFSAGEFLDFASDVAKARIREALEEEVDLNTLFPGFTKHQEAAALSEIKGSDFKQRIENINSVARKTNNETLKNEKDLNKFLISLWIEENQLDLKTVAASYAQEHKQWLRRFNNYGYESLFSIRKGKSGINKYYCGIKTFVIMSGCNIRNFLELIEASLVLGAKEGLSNNGVSPISQTEAAIDVGARRIRDIQERSLTGGTIAKTLLGLGRLFSIASKRLTGFPPETTAFELISSNDNDETDKEKIDTLLKECVKHLVLIRHFANKLRSDGEIAKDEYQIHPFFSAFFKCSHRRKRKIQLTYAEIEGLVDSPKYTIRKIVANKTGKNCIPGEDNTQLDLL